MRSFVLGIFILLHLSASSQFGYNTIGDTYGVSNISNLVCGQVDSCFTLTDNITSQKGAVWDNKPINLFYNFDASFCMTLGSNDAAGADGFAFVLRSQTSDTIGLNGSGLGFFGITPSVAIEFDTWENSGQQVNDIPADHTAMYINGDYLNPAVSATPLYPNSANVEDGNYHTSRIVWNATTHNLKMYFDGNLRMNYTSDLINTVFGGENLITWGFTASTGGATNLQQICFPKYSISLQDENFCEGDSVRLHFYNSNLTSYKWTYQDGTVIKDWNTIDFPGPLNLSDTAFYTSQTGTYYLEVAINNQVVEDSLVVTSIQNPLKPFADGIGLNCFENNTYTLDALNPGNTYSWSNGQTSQLIMLNQAGTYWIDIFEPVIGCTNSDTIKIINFCKDTVICEGDNAPIFFYEPNLSSYTWTYQDGTEIENWNNVDFSGAFDLNDTIFYATQDGTYYLDLTINSQVIRDSVKLTVIANPVQPFFDEEITVCLDEKPLPLNALNDGSYYLWSTGDTIQEISVSDTGTYYVEITEPNLICKTSDTITVFSMCNPEITIPNIFSPNGDLLNDQFELIVKNFEWVEHLVFKVYNRWGQEVFHSEDSLVKWDGKVKGEELDEGVYFYTYSYSNLFSGEAFSGQGNIQLVR